ncbi:glucose-methanol-choline oxidoreductase [Teratosphaeria nubilosa]|uniref:Glucose-methanol-choline oxidoreductase n=1 Tax=Teratosphaeria nubilosa TaxID=161662 RepID=A0A6G1LLN9_9PEZI|nr:glucose-methanol-choline oxidoreductase [Teratosphaeria nubilosa]
MVIKSNTILFTSCLAAAALAQDAPPDFSSYQYPGAPNSRSFLPEYDFCIVGGGTAGLVLANRLSESGRHQVVVFEAGGPPTDVGTYRTPGGNQYVLNGAFSAIDYNFKTVPQVNMNNRSFAYHRGRALGGSSSTNGLYYGLGSSTVYDQWETDGNPGWNWAAIKAAAKKGTTFVGNPNHTNDPTFMTWDPSVYGNGPLKIGFQGRVVTSNPSFMKAILFDRYGNSSDALSGNASEAEPRAVGVTFVDSTSGVFQNISCSNEVIVSAGAFHSPFILKQSGIGPEDELKQFGIEPIVINENVGNHMQDHTAFSVVHAVKPEFAREASTTDMENDVHVLNTEQRNFFLGDSSLTTNTSLRWKSKWSAPSGCTNGFQEIPDAELDDIGAGDIITAGLTHQAHNEILYESIWYPKFYSDKYGAGGPKKNTSYISVTVSNLAALSRGCVKIGSNNPTSDPIIDPNYLAEAADQAMAVQGVKYLRKIMAHPEMQKWSDGEVAPGPDVQTDEEILEYAKDTMVPNWHASSTCRMLPKEKGGVVDSRLRVYGTKGLRVCDVSTFGRLPDVNLVGPVYAAAEVGAQVIREDYDDL